MKVKAHPHVHSLESGKGKWRKPSSTKQLQGKLAARKANSTCHECGQSAHWAGDPGCPGTRDTNFTTWSDEHVLPGSQGHHDGPTTWTIRAFLFCANTLSARFLSRICNSPPSMCTHRLSQRILAITYLSPLVLFLLCSRLTLEKWVDLWWGVRSAVNPSQISDWESSTHLVSSVWQAQTGG